MDTIIRQDNKILVYRTVVETIKVVIRSPGIFYIADIQKAINSQLQPDEYFSRDEVRRALARILSKVKET